MVHQKTKSSIPHQSMLIIWNINTPFGSSPEDTVKFYAPGSGLTYNKVKFCELINGLLREIVNSCIHR